MIENEIHPWEAKASRADITYDKPVKGIFDAMCKPQDDAEFKIFAGILDHYIITSEEGYKPPKRK